MAASREEPAYVFGYGSLVELTTPMWIGAVAHQPIAGRLNGFRRLWGVAMNNWEAVDTAKHWVEPGRGGKPRIRVAYLDIEEREGASVNGLAVPVDASRLAALDAREGNYERFEASAAFRPAAPGSVFAYRGLEAARERCRLGAEHGDVFVSREYLDQVHRAFAALAPDALAEFEQTTGPVPFPIRDLERVPADG
jgi:hypothetical protein